MQMSMHLQHAFFNTLWLWMWRWLWLWLWLWQNANVKTNPNAMSIHCDTGQSKSLFVWFHACTNDQSLVGCNTGMRMWMPMPMPMPMPIPDALAETTILFESNIFFFVFHFVQLCQTSVHSSDAEVLDFSNWWAFNRGRQTLRKPSCAQHWKCSKSFCRMRYRLGKTKKRN